MIELGKLIYRKRDDRAECWYRMARLLIEGIREHAIEGDTGDYDEFRSNMKALEARLDPATPASEVLVLAGSAVKELENYNRGATRFLSAKASQLEHMVHMLARAVQESTALDQGSVERLKRIERRLEKASAIEDVLAVKAHLGECLYSVIAETNTHADQLQSLAHSLPVLGDYAPQNPPGETVIPSVEVESEYEQQGEGPLDRLTGLAQRQSALQHFSESARSGLAGFVVVLHVKQLAAVNHRYGIEIGDGLLLSVCARLEGVLGPADRMFRWTDDSLVAILQRPGELVTAISEVRRAIPKHAKESFSFKSRSLMLTLNVEVYGYRMSDFRRTDELIGTIDQILGIQLESQVTGANA